MSASEFNLSLGGLLRRNSRERADVPAIICGERVITHAELWPLARAAAARFRESGLKKGGVAGVFARKTPESIISFYGVALAGGMFFPLDWNQPVELIARVLELAQPDLLVCAPEFASVLGQAMPLGLDVQVLGLEAAGQHGFGKWLANPPDLAELPDAGPKDMVYFNFTSGTTGAPKAALASFGNILWNTRASVEALELTPDDVHLCMMPIFVHPHEIFARPLYLGGCMVLDEQVSPKTVARTLTRHKVTAFMAVASIYETLVRLTDISSYDFSALRVPESGGMHVTETLYDIFFRRFGRRMLPVWGSTESTGIALANRPGEEYRPGSMGRPCPHYKVYVADKEGRALAPGEPGELVVEGPGVCRHYFGVVANNASQLSGGRFKTQDIVTYDEDGFYYFLSRESGMMKVGGIKVYPTEIEEVLRAHPGVAEVVVIRQEDELRGEAPKAFVTPLEGVELSRSELRKYCELHLHRNKIPRHFEIRQSLQRTPGGKIAWKSLS